MSQICRIRKIRGRYYPAYPDGIPMRGLGGYEDPAEAYEVAEDAVIAFVFDGSDQVLTLSQASAKAGIKGTSNFSREMAKEAKSGDPWHNVRGHRIRYALY